MRKQKILGNKKGQETITVVVDNPESTYLMIEINGTTVVTTFLHGKPVSFPQFTQAMLAVRDQAIYDMALSQVKNEKAEQPENN